MPQRPTQEFQQMSQTFLTNIRQHLFLEVLRSSLITILKCVCGHTRCEDESNNEANTT